MSNCKRRLKFVNERTDLNTQMDTTREVQMDESDEEAQFDAREEIEMRKRERSNNKAQQDANNNATVCREDGEASDSEGEVVINTKICKTKQKVKSKLVVPNKKQQPSTSATGATGEAPDSSGFEQFMVWMDRYKQFQEWEASQTSSSTSEARDFNRLAASAGSKGKKLTVSDKAIQSPSESTIYTRMCKSIDTDLGVISDQTNIANWATSGGDKAECSSTATTIDDYAGIDEDQIDALILDARKAAVVDKEAQGNRGAKRKRESTSDSDLDGDIGDEQAKRMLAEHESKERRDKILLDAELHRAELLKPGKVNLMHLVLDAKHKSLGSHIDQATELKIINNEFIDLERLLPKKGRHRFRNRKKGLAMINNNGRPEFIEDDDGTDITSYIKWEEAFEIFASIYIRGNPGRAHELYDYKHTIRDASTDYIWDNVYDYDIEFRTHMAKCKGKRSWSAKMNDEWSRYMKNHLRFDRTSVGEHVHRPAASDQGAATNSKTRELCRRYNKGRCTWGEKCRYLHACSVCGKRGHGALICRKNKGKKGAPEGEKN